MKKFRIISWVFSAAAILLSNVMCALVAYSYCDMIYGIKYKCYSAPASTAFLLAIPFLFGIIICSMLALIFYKKAKSL